MKNVLLQLIVMTVIVTTTRCSSGVSNSAGYKDQQVIAAVLRTISDDQRCAPCLLETESSPYQPWVTETAGARTAVSAEMMTAYARRNGKHRKLPGSSLMTGYRLIQPTDVSRYFEMGPREGWDRLRADFGPRVGLVRISLPAYSSSDTEALITYSYDAGPLGGETNYVGLSRRNGVWRTEKSTHIIMS